VAEPRHALRVGRLGFVTREPGGGGRSNAAGSGFLGGAGSHVAGRHWGGEILEAVGGG
jgi:hypothetical protein